jgi:hypothetical protein
MDTINKVDEDELNKEDEDLIGKRPKKYVRVPKNLEEYDTKGSNANKYSPQ